VTSVSHSAVSRFKRDSRTLDEDEEMWFDQDDDDADLAKLDIDYEPLDKLLISNKFSGKLFISYLIVSVLFIDE
jgi:hypothetical protein